MGLPWKELAAPIAIFTGFAALFVILFLVNRKKHYQSLVPIAEAFGGNVVRSFWGFYCSFSLHEVEGRVKLVPKTKYQPPAVNLILMQPLDFTMSVYRANFATKGLGKLGLFKDVKSGDPLFDKKYAIKASDEIRAGYLLQDSEKREALDWLFKAGFQSFSSTKDQVVVSLPYYKKEHLDPAWVREAFNRMLKVLGRA